MSETRASAWELWLALGLGALALLLYSGGVALFVAGPGFTHGRIFTGVGVVVFSAVGALIVSRQPHNAIGWIFCATGVVSGLGTLSDGYATYWLSDQAASKIWGQLAATYESTSWIMTVVVPVTFLLLLFPNGRALSRRWRIVTWCAAVGILGSFVTQMLLPGPLEDYPEIANPYGVDSLVRTVIAGASALLLVAAVVAAPVALVLRMRRADPVQRQQIKWLAWAGAVAAPTLVLGSALGYPYLGEAITNALIVSTILGLPIATGVAIVRHRLYDIDVVINRTLVYGSLTAILAAAYLGSVLLLQLALQGVTRDSGLAVAGSTLAVAALFRPVRTRIQAGVDRRFYRHRYDAQRTLESFTARLRDQVDLTALDTDLRGVVTDTMQPAHVSLWLRGVTQ